MQPVALHRRLRALDIDPGDSIGDVWRRLRTRLGLAGALQRCRESLRPGWSAWTGFLVRTAFTVLIVTPSLALGTAAALSGLGVAVGLADVAFGILIGVPLMLVWSLYISVPEAAILASTFGLALGLANGFLLETGFMLALGVAAGMAPDLARGLRAGRSASKAGVILSPMILVIGLYLGFLYFGAYEPGVPTTAALVGFSAGVAAGLRLPIYLVEVTLQFFLYLGDRFGFRPGGPLLRFTPVLHHEVSHFPHPFLRRHVELIAEEEPALVERVLDATALSPGQRPAGQKALAALQARSLRQILDEGAFERLAALRIEWLPATQAPSRLLCEMQQFSVALEEGDILEAEKLLENLEIRLRSTTDPLAIEVRDTLPAFQEALEIKALPKAAENAGRSV